MVPYVYTSLFFDFVLKYTYHKNLTPMIVPQHTPNNYLTANVPLFLQVHMRHNLQPAPSMSSRYMYSDVFTNTECVYVSTYTTIFSQFGQSQYMYWGVIFIIYLEFGVTNGYCFVVLKCFYPCPALLEMSFHKLFPLVCSTFP